MGKSPKTRFSASNDWKPTEHARSARRDLIFRDHEPEKTKGSACWPIPLMFSFFVALDAVIGYVDESMENEKTDEEADDFPHGGQ